MARRNADEAGDLPLADRITLRPPEAAAVLGVSERTFRSLLPSLPHFREGGVVLIPVDELRRWAAERARSQVSAHAGTARDLIEKIANRKAS